MKNGKILAVVVAVCLIGFGIVPLHKSVKNFTEKNKTLLEKKEKKLAELKELTTESKESGDNLIDPEVRIPRKLEQTDLLVDLQVMASQTNIVLPSSWNFSVEDDKDLGLTKIKVSFPLTGSRGDIYKFLKLSEENKRFLLVDGLAVRSVAKNEAPVSEMNIGLTAFSQEKIKK